MAAQQAAAPPPHLLLIVLENTEFGSVIGNVGAAPYLNALAGRYALATRYFASAHPSLPNYLSLIAGSTFGLDGSDCPTCMVQGRALTDELTAHGVGWTAYMDGIPSPCFNGPSGTGAHPYARKHDPFLYFPQNLTGPCHVVPLTKMAADLATGRASPFLWISPDLCNDGHDAVCGLPAADSWTARTLPGILASSWYQQGGTVLVVWDEGTSDLGCCAGAYGGHIAAIVVSQRVSPTTRLASPLDHAGALRGIEELYGVGLLGASANPANGDLLPLLHG